MWSFSTSFWSDGCIDLFVWLKRPHGRSQKTVPLREPGIGLYGWYGYTLNMSFYSLGAIGLHKSLPLHTVFPHLLSGWGNPDGTVLIVYHTFDVFFGFQFKILSIKTIFSIIFRPLFTNLIKFFGSLELFKLFIHIKHKLNYM